MTLTNSSQVQFGHSRKEIEDETSPWKRLILAARVCLNNGNKQGAQALYRRALTYAKVDGADKTGELKTFLVHALKSSVDEFKSNQAALIDQMPMKFSPNSLPSMVLWNLHAAANETTFDPDQKPQSAEAIVHPPHTEAYTLDYF